MNDQNRVRILRQIIALIVETIFETGNMAPSSAIYMAVATIGMRIDVYDSIINELVNQGVLNRDNHILSVNVDRAVEKGLIPDPAKKEGADYEN